MKTTTGLVALALMTLPLLSVHAQTPAPTSATTQSTERASAMAGGAPSGVTNKKVARPPRVRLTKAQRAARAAAEDKTPAAAAGAGGQ